MNKEEILKKAREENKGADEVERAAVKVAATVSLVVGACACLILSLIDECVLKTTVIARTCWIIYDIMLATYAWVRAIKQKQKLFWILAPSITVSGILMINSLFWYLYLIEKYA